MPGESSTFAGAVPAGNGIRLGRGVESVSWGMAARQAELVDWESLRTGGGTRDLGGDLMTLLAVEGPKAVDAYRRMENAVVSQGHLFECAPSVVRVLMSAIAEGSVPDANLGAVLDLLCRILVGYPDDSETDAGNGDLDEQCHREALKGYWSLMRVANGRDAFDGWKLARDALAMLDETHVAQFFE